MNRSLSEVIRSMRFAFHRVRADRVRGIVAVLSVALVPTLLPAQGEEPSELDQLRGVEERTVRTIEKATSAFVFIRSTQLRNGGRIGSESSGSGFLISADGLVLTNDHVVLGGNKIQCYLPGGRLYNAKIVGRAPQGDVALLRLAGASGLPFLELGDSDKVRVGQRVIAIGDPFLLGRAEIFPSGAPANYQPSVSAGVVSAVNRYSDTYNDAIQVDLAVNRGNSGGPLLNESGKVIGINGKIETRFVFGVNTGVGYAVPTHQIRRFLEPLKRGEIARHGAIRGLRVGERANDKPGLPITGVTRDSPAYRAGFRSGDYLVRLAGLPVRTESRFKGILGTYPAGEEIPVEVERDGSRVQLTATLIAPGGAPYLGITPDRSARVEGVRIEVVAPATPAARAGLEEGDVIVSFDGEKITNTVELAARIRKRQPGDRVTLKILRDGKSRDVDVTLIGRI